jgi:hypothetical protein
MDMPINETKFQSPITPHAPPRDPIENVYDASLTYGLRDYRNLEAIITSIIQNYQALNPSNKIVATEPMPAALQEAIVVLIAAGICRQYTEVKLQDSEVVNTLPNLETVIISVEKVGKALELIMGHRSCLPSVRQTLFIHLTYGNHHTLLSDGLERFNQKQSDKNRPMRIELEEACASQAPALPSATFTPPTPSAALSIFNYYPLGLFPNATLRDMYHLGRTCKSAWQIFNGDFFSPLLTNLGNEYAERMQQSLPSVYRNFPLLRKPHEMPITLLKELIPNAGPLTIHKIWGRQWSIEEAKQQLEEKAKSEEFSRDLYRYLTDEEFHAFHKYAVDGSWLTQDLTDDAIKETAGKLTMIHVQRHLDITLSEGDIDQAQFDIVLEILTSREIRMILDYSRYGIPSLPYNATTRGANTLIDLYILRRNEAYEGYPKGKAPFSIAFFKREVLCLTSEEVPCFWACEPYHKKRAISPEQFFALSLLGKRLLLSWVQFPNKQTVQNIIRCPEVLKAQLLRSKELETAIKAGQVTLEQLSNLTQEELDQMKITSTTRMSPQQVVELCNAANQKSPKQEDQKLPKQEGPCIIN